MSKTFVILGGYGNAGLELAGYLLHESDVRLVLAGRSQEKAELAAATLNARVAGQRVSARRADAADSESLKRAFQGVDLALVASTTTAYTKEVVDAALAAGIDYLDIQYAPERLPALRALAGDIEKAGLCFVTEAGFHPGLPAALVRYLGQFFDRMDSAIGGTVLNEEGGFPYSSGAEELVQEFRDYKADVFDGGAWRAADMRTMKDNRTIDFGQPFGCRSCTPMTLAEMYDLPGMFPSLQRLGFYVAGFNWFADWIVMPVMMLALRMWPQRAVTPMTRLLCWATKRFSAPPYGNVLKVDAAGMKSGQPLTRSVVLSHADGYKLTAIPVVAYLLQYLDGSARTPGLHMMGHIADPTRLLHDMQRMGVTVAT